MSISLAYVICHHPHYWCPLFLYCCFYCYKHCSYIYSPFEINPLSKCIDLKDIMALYFSNF